MSKAIVKIDIPTDYADEYRQWKIEGRLCYLEDGAWTHLKDIECELKPTDKAIPVKRIENWVKETYPITEDWKDYMVSFGELIEAWEKENEQEN